MQGVKVIDKDGDWFVNRGLYRMVDPTHGEGKEVFLEPGEPTKVKLTDWMLGQSLIVSCPDPVNSDEPMPAQIDTPENTLTPVDPVTGDPVEIPVMTPGKPKGK